MNPLYSDTDWQRLVDNEPNHGDSYRLPARKDYARLLHSACWRRMQGKTQLFPGLDSEFFRNRLTHSLEVAQIAKSIALKLNAEGALKGEDGKPWPIDLDLVEFAGLAHDLGHPPFGHEGEHALDEMMKDHGGFEGNAQTLRILSFLEEKVRAKPSDDEPAVSFGLNLTLRSLAAVLKYDRPIPLSRTEASSPVKGYYEQQTKLVDTIKAGVSRVESPEPGQFKTLECTIMDVADDIAYSTYDFEDAMKAGFKSPIDLLAQSQDIMVRVLASTNANLARENIAPINELQAGQILTELVSYSGLYDSLPITGSGVATPQETVAQSKAVLEASQAIAQINMLRTRFTSALIGLFVDAVKVKANPENPPLSKAYLDPPMRTKVELLKHLNFETVIRSHRLRVVAHRGRAIVRKIFKAIEKNSDLLPDLQLAQYRELAAGSTDAMRCICDYVAGLTDREAVDFYSRLRSETHTTIFKPIS
jgi:dGTPase